MNELKIGDRKIGPNYAPLVIAEIGINHEGSFDKAMKMVDDAFVSGCECVKFQCHIIDDEMIPAAKSVVPGNAKMSIWDIMKKCTLTEKEETELKDYTESKGMIYLNTPFSRAAAERLEKMGIAAYKIGSGECNNYPLIQHIASYYKPVILSTGMNDLTSIKPAVEILRKKRVPFALMHCTSIYPTPYEKVRLGALSILANEFPDAAIGLSDHSKGIYTCLGAVALGASIVEKHFTSDRSWPGPDMPISITPAELEQLIKGSFAVYKALGGEKDVLKGEKPTIDFAYACAVTLSDIKAGDELNYNNIWVKRPGTGQIRAEHFSEIIGKKVKTDIKKDTQLRWEHIDD